MRSEEKGVKTIKERSEVETGEKSEDKQKEKQMKMTANKLM